GYLHPVETALADIPALDLTGPQAQRLRAGQVVQAPNANPGAVCAMADGLPVALGHVEDGEVRAVRVFNL
ncbi:MAG: tRNA pseudouridine(55) synthase TruB, partial [Alphaproteobacteria bacterium]|nr:tRNA pseudouridine(55) synthase TruB [Alphaproteobacteria bacterium]